MKTMRRRRRPAAKEFQQNLVPGTLDEVSIEHISSKLTWEACNALQAVSKGWQSAIHDRTVYNARVRSRSTEAFFVLYCHVARRVKFFLYSCEDNKCFQLPRFPKAYPIVFRYLCLDGRVYVWVRERKGTPPCLELHVLDLAGDRKWTQRRRTSLRPEVRYHGILDGKVYIFSPRAGPGPCPTRPILDGSETPANHLLPYRDDPRKRKREFELYLAHIVEYDPDRDVWTIVTPKASSTVDMQPQLHFTSRWARKHQEAAPSEPLLNDGWYEPFFSEWRRRRQVCSSTPSTPDNGWSDAMATQVWCESVISSSEVPQPGSIDQYRVEDLLFLRGKLLKWSRCAADKDNSRMDMQVYDTQKNAWEPWKSFLAEFHPPGAEVYRFYVESLTPVDNVIWATGYLRHNNKIVKYYLLKSPPLADDDNVTVVKWIETPLPTLIPGGIFCMRPIYV